VPAEEPKAREAEFIMIKDGFLVFEGEAEELRTSQDAYLKTFLS
jgi:ABC-type transporter Mla maintaining outer membrane lipid asymmetry ATPase subunit MlaF